MLPEEIKEAFVDSDFLSAEKMKKLKEMLQEQFPVSFEVAFVFIMC